MLCTCFWFTPKAQLNTKNIHNFENVVEETFKDLSYLSSQDLWCVSYPTLITYILDISILHSLNTPTISNQHTHDLNCETNKNKS